MPYLMHIAFDNPLRLARKVNYFEYKGVRFKLVQNDPRKWADVLLTITDSYKGPPAQRAYAAAGEFASALSWTNGAGIPIRHIGGPGVRQAFRLRQAQCTTFVFPEVPFRGMHIGHSISRIAHITNDEQRIGLTLFREADSSNKVLLSILLYWQILEIRHGDPVGWVNKVMRRGPGDLHRVREKVHELPLGGRSLGNYLLEDCRHAIAHIRRQPGRRPLQFDNGEENLRLAISALVLEELARFYIRTELGVVANLHLVRRRGRGFPLYLDEPTITRGWYTAVRDPPVFTKALRRGGK